MYNRISRKHRHKSIRRRKYRKSRKSIRREKTTRKKYRGGGLVELLNDYTGKDYPIQVLSNANIDKKSTFGHKIMKLGKLQLTEIKNRSCDGISSKNDLDIKFGWFRDQSTSKMQNQFTLKLFPYCGEKIQEKELLGYKVGSSFDQVNKSSINKDVLNIIEQSFNIKIDSNQNELNHSKNDKQEDIITSVYDPSIFKTFITRFGNIKKNTTFIVTHSNFMNELLQVILDRTFQEKAKFQFNNLDIIQLCIYNDKIKYIIIRRILDHYTVSIAIEIGDDNTLTVKTEFIDYKSIYTTGFTNGVMDGLSIDDYFKKYKNIFLMRHCVGCHNLEEGIFAKSYRYVGQSSGNKGYLEYSICLQQTVYDMRYHKKALKDILEKYCHDQDIATIQFGSSVIFRAILTCILQYNILLETDTQASMRSPSMRSTLKRSPSMRSPSKRSPSMRSPSKRSPSMRSPSMT